MPRLLKTLWRDESGSMEFAGWMFVVVVLAIGAVVGLTTVRDQITQQLGDTAVALESLDQSYSFTIASPTSTIAGMYTDTPTTLADPPNASPAGIQILGVEAQPESGS